MRVLLISGEYPPMQGGVADFSAILANELARQGAEVHVLTSIEAGAQARADAVRVHAILRAWRWAPLYRAVRELLRDVRPEVINIQYQAAAYGMHPAINLLPRVFPGVPAVVTFHDLKVPYLFPKAGALRWRVVLELARASRAVIVTNEEDRLQLEGRRGMPQLYQIPIGSNITTASPADDARDAWRDRWGIAPDALVLCYFGFLNPSKGGEELIEALAELRTRGYTPYLLMIGGSVGASDPTNRAYLERVRASIAQHGLEERVVWTGHMDAPEVSAAFRSADMCVLPYRDGASFRRGSLMAALAHGMPIVSTAPQVALPELAHMQNIWLVPPCDPQRLADAIERLARDPALRERLGKGARDLSHRFGWEEIATQTLKVYGEATEKRR